MQFCTASVRVGGSPSHVVTNKLVSVPEIRLLQAIHGEDAVVDIVPLENRAVTSEAERERLRLAYEPKNVEEQAGVVNRVFGPMGALPQTLTQIGLDPKAEARALRDKAKSLLAAADKVEQAEESEDEDIVSDEIDDSGDEVADDDASLNFDETTTA